MFSSQQDQTQNTCNLLTFLKDYIGAYRNIWNYLFLITVSGQQKSDIGLTQSLGSTSGYDSDKWGYKPSRLQSHLIFRLLLK